MASCPPTRAALLPVDAHGASEQNLAVLGPVRGALGGIEPRLDAGGLRAVTDERAVGSNAQCERQPHRHQGLAGAGLPREDVQAGVQVEIEVVDDPETADVQLPQHACTLPAGADIAVVPVRRITRQLELVAHPREEGRRPGTAHQAGRPLGGFDASATADRQLDALAAVCREESGFVPHDLQDDLLVSAQHEGTVEDHVRRDRREHQAAHLGLTIGPRAENEYAVEPVGVATTTPSAENVVTYSPSTSTASLTRRCRARFSTMISFNAHWGTNSAPPSAQAVADSRSSMDAPPESASRMRSSASSGSTSVRNPSRPTFTPSTGQSRSAATCAPPGTFRPPHRHDQVSRRSIVEVWSPDHRHAGVPQGGAEHRGRIDGGGATLVHDETDDAHPRCPSLTAVSRSTGASSTPRRPWSRNSTLPAGPRSGEATTPITPTPCERNAPPTSPRTRRHTAGSRTTPPLPDVRRPRFELRLDQHHELRIGTRDENERRQHRAQRDEREVRYHEVGNERQICGLEAADVRSFHHRDPGVVADLPCQLAVSHVDGRHASGASLQQAIGEPTRRGPGVEAIAVARVHVETIERAIGVSLLRARRSVSAARSRARGHRRKPARPP